VVSIDVLFTEIDTLITNVSLYPPIGFSDHNGIDGWNVFMSVLRQAINMYVPSSELVTVGKQSRRL